jgi:hypothetical protein
MLPASDRMAEIFSAYSYHILGIRNVYVILDDDRNGSAFADSFGQEFGGRGLMRPFKYEEKNPDNFNNIRTFLGGIEKESFADAILLATGADTTVKLLELMEELPSGVRILVTPAMVNSPEVARRLGELAARREGNQHGRFSTITSNMWSMMDMRLAEAFGNIARRRDPPPAALAHLHEASEILQVILARIRSGEDEVDTATIPARILEVLREIRSLDSALLISSGPVYFDNFRNRIEVARIGSFEADGFEPMPVQLVRNQRILPFNLEEDQKFGQYIKLNNTILSSQAVVRFGMHLNEAENFDVGRGLISLDFFLWFRSPNIIDPFQITFSNAESISGQNQPIQNDTVGDEVYRLYRIRGIFRQQLDVRRFPFDHQNVVVRFLNGTYDTQDLIYAEDRRSPELIGAANRRATDKLGQWDATTWSLGQAAVTLNSDLGDRRLAAWQQQRSYPGGIGELRLTRRALPYILKNLTPLIILTGAVLVSLFFPLSLAKERITVPITCILSASVLLLSINRGLPEVAYTTSIEKLFYWFFVGSFYALCVALGVETFRDRTSTKTYWSFTKLGPWGFVSMTLVAIVQFAGYQPW